MKYLKKLFTLLVIALFACGFAACSSDDDTESVFTCGFRELCSLFRCSVGTVYMNFNRYSVLLQDTDAFFNYWKI